MAFARMSFWRHSFGETVLCFALSFWSHSCFALEPSWSSRRSQRPTSRLRRGNPQFRHPASLRFVLSTRQRFSPPPRLPLRCRGSRGSKDSNRWNWRSFRRPSNSISSWPNGRKERKALSDSLTGDAKEVAERCAKLQAEGKFAAVDSFSLATLDGHAASVKMGQTRPYVTSVQRTTFGTSNGVQLYDVGTLANLLPQVFENDKVLLQIRFEKSALENSDDLPALMETTDGKKVPSAMITRFSSDTTVRLASGRTVMAAGASSKSDRHVLLISAKVVP